MENEWWFSEEKYVKRSREKSERETATIERLTQLMVIQLELTFFDKMERLLELFLC